MPALRGRDTRSEIVQVGRQIRRDRARPQRRNGDASNGDVREGGGRGEVDLKKPGTGGKQVDRGKREDTWKGREEGKELLQGSSSGREDCGRFPKRGGRRG